MFASLVLLTEIPILLGFCALLLLAEPIGAVVVVLHEGQYERAGHGVGP
jgi:hypothetical protein